MADKTAKNIMHEVAYRLKRPVEKIGNIVVNGAVYLWTKRHFDFRVKGLENLPERSAIIVPNHCHKYDGLLIKPLIRFKGNKTIHFLVQGGKVYNKFKPILWFAGDIPVGVDAGSSKKAVFDRVNTYLLRTDALIGIFSEGPTKNLIDENGNMPPLEEREHYRGAAHFSIRTRAPIIPTGVYSDAVEIDNKGRQRYYLNIGEPIYPGTLKKKDLTARVKEQVCMLARTARD